MERVVTGLRGRLVLSVLALLCLTGVHAMWSPYPAGAQEVIGVDVLVEEAMRTNQELQSIEQKARAVRAEAPFAGSLKDPVLGLAFLNLPVDSFAFDEQPMTQKQISLSQQVPWFGKLSLAEQAVELMAAELDALVLAMRLKVARQVREAWYELSYVGHNIEITRRLKEIVTQILRVAEARYSTGDGLQQDILMAQVELSELIDKEVGLQGEKRRIQDTLGALLNRETTFIAEPLPLRVPDLTGMDREQLVAAALASNPLIGARRSAVMKAEVDVLLAEKEYMPDMNFTVAYGQRDEMEEATEHDDVDFFSVGVTFTLPLWQNTRQDSKLAGAQRRLQAARLSLASLQRELPHQVDGVLAEIAAASESRALYSEAISVQASQLADSSLAAYSVGKVEFATMLSARMRELRVELTKQRYASQIYKKIAALEEMVGQPTGLL